jgi:hypothetical protein
MFIIINLKFLYSAIMEVDSEDYLQDIVFDYYGTKMAVCSSDRKIKVYDKNESEERWDQVASWEVINSN